LRSRSSRAERWRRGGQTGDLRLKILPKALKEVEWRAKSVGQQHLGSPCAVRGGPCTGYLPTDGVAFVEGYLKDWAFFHTMVPAAPQKLHTSVASHHHAGV